MSSNAAKEWSGTFKELEQKRSKIKRHIQHHISEHKKHDQHTSRNEERRQRSEQAIETLTRAHQKIDTFLKSASPRMGKGKIKREVKSNITDNESARMTTSKGTIQGYNGVASVDKKHQVIIDAQAFGEGQEHHTLQPVLETIKDRYKRLGFSESIYDDGIIVTADTGFANEANNQYLHENNINAYVPDNKFRSRDPQFKDQKKQYGKRTDYKKLKTVSVIPASEFNLNEKKTCLCPAGELMWLKNEGIDKRGNYKLFFEGRLSKCRDCSIKNKCMSNPGSANTRTARGRQVSFILDDKRTSNFTDWMKRRVDSDKGKLIYSHRMSVVEPVFGNLSSNKELSRLSLRSKRKVQSQWKLFCIVHNIEKLMNYGTMAA